MKECGSQFLSAIIKAEVLWPAKAEVTSLDPEPEGDHKTPSLITLFLKASVQSNIL